jgi:hypothetical protein
MLEGTDLFAAYQSFQQEEAPAPLAPQGPPIKQEVQPTFNKELFNQQYEQEQRIAKAIQELKKQKESFNAALQAAPAPPQQEGVSYIDKLTSKKKELGRMLQYALIIALGLSIHFLVDEYIKYYIANNDVSIERQIIIKLLYPLSLVFIIWNLKAFVR